MANQYKDVPLLPDVPVIFGSDNGKSGHLVFLTSDTAEILHIEGFPNDGKRLYQLLNYFY